MQDAEEAIQDDRFRVENVHRIPQGDAKILELACHFGVHGLAAVRAKRLLELARIAAADPGQFKKR